MKEKTADIDILEELLKNGNSKNRRGNKEIKFEINSNIHKYFSNLISENKELKKHYEHEQEYINGEVFSAKQMHFIEDEYIPKSKIEELIEKLKKEENLINAEYFIKELQSLLGKE